jgi:hypothetical protein
MKDLYWVAGVIVVAMWAVTFAVSCSTPRQHALNPAAKARCHNSSSADCDRYYDWREH